MREKMKKLDRIIDIGLGIVLLSSGMVVGTLQIGAIMARYILILWLGILDKIGRKRVIMDRDNKEAYLERYYLLFKDRGEGDRFNIFLHKFLKSDTDMHDHPWGYCTIILSGGYWENEFKTVDSANIVKYWRGSGYIGYYDAYHSHKVELESGKGCWTLFIPYRREREWGFWKIKDRKPRRSDRLKKSNKEIIKDESEEDCIKDKEWVIHNEYKNIVKGE